MATPLQVQNGTKLPTVGEMMAQLSLCTIYLKEQRKEKTFDQIMSYLSLQGTSPDQKEAFRRFLQQDAEKIAYNHQTGKFRYRPAIPAENPKQLLEYLRKMQQEQDAFLGLKVDDIKDGWVEDEAVDTALIRLEGEGKLLLSKDSRGRPKTAFANEAGIFSGNIDDDLRSLWHSKKLPSTEEDLRKSLESWGLKAATAPKVAPSAGASKQKKARAPRKGGRQTNTHMLGILKDYSHKRA